MEERRTYRRNGLPFACREDADQYYREKKQQIIFEALCCGTGLVVLVTMMEVISWL